jgi:hypothetical protein
VNYVTVFPAAPRKGWIAARRTPNGIRHIRLEASIHDPENARSEAAAMFPGVRVVMPDDPKPWTLTVV